MPLCHIIRYKSRKTVVRVTYETTMERREVGARAFSECGSHAVP